MDEVGNLYSGSLLAWIAAALETAQRNAVDLGSQKVLAIGYGSGDAAEVLELTVVDGFEEPARNIQFEHSLRESVAVSAEVYQSLHSGERVLSPKKTGVFLLKGTDDPWKATLHYGIELYQYVT